MRSKSERRQVLKGEWMYRHDEVAVGHRDRRPLSLSGRAALRRHAGHVGGDRPLYRYAHVGLDLEGGRAGPA
ncbi:MAG TPA: hypothetical protein VJ386_12110 [Candidatus Deferrimicrobiaceae bacterium]|nr:hypothetical protein [Candidatus Deferrimicrobiaceae bacterium]